MNSISFYKRIPIGVCLTPETTTFKWLIAKSKGVGNCAPAALFGYLSQFAPEHFFVVATRLCLFPPGGSVDSVVVHGETLQEDFDLSQYAIVRIRCLIDTFIRDNKQLVYDRLAMYRTSPPVTEFDYSVEYTDPPTDPQLIPAAIFTAAKLQFAAGSGTDAYPFGNLFDASACRHALHLMDRNFRFPNSDTVQPKPYFENIHLLILVALIAQTGVNVDIHIWEKYPKQPLCFGSKIPFKSLFNTFPRYFAQPHVIVNLVHYDSSLAHRGHYDFLYSPELVAESDMLSTGFSPSWVVDLVDLGFVRKTPHRIFRGPISSKRIQDKAASRAPKRGKTADSSGDQTDSHDCPSSHGDV
jgi:hypothetical protein